MLNWPKYYDILAIVEHLSNMINFFIMIIKSYQFEVNQDKYELQISEI
jgi:hypothetical protein